MDNNATNFTYPGSTAPAVTPPPSGNGQSGQFSHVAPPVSPAVVDDNTPAPTLSQILQAENSAVADQALQQKLNTQTPLVGDVNDGSVVAPIDQTNAVEGVNASDSAGKSALASLAEKLNSFKASLIEEVPDSNNVANDTSTVDTTLPVKDVDANQGQFVGTETTVDAPAVSDTAMAMSTPDFSIPTAPDYQDALAQDTSFQDSSVTVEEVKAEELPTTWSADTNSVTDNLSNLGAPQYDPAQNVNPVMYSESPAPALNDAGSAPIVADDTTFANQSSLVSISEQPVAPVAMPGSLDMPAPIAEPQPYVQTAVSAPEFVGEDVKYPFTIFQLLDIVIERNASDLHLTVGYPASIRVDGSLVPVSEVRLTQEMVELMIGEVLPDAKKELLEVNREVDLAYSHGGVARFRINAFFQQQTLAAAFRLIPTRIKTIDELQLPQIYHQLTKLRQGFVLVTGPTGSGKSTTLAAILQEINQTRADHLITVEDPIEYIFPKGKAVVNQRELHEDTHSWEIAMKSALRQDPDVVLVGEMRDYETVSAAITLAETGHLVFATLHTNSCSQTIDRIIDVFPEHQQSQVRSQLSNVLEAVVAQRLIPLDKGGRKAVSEIMIATAAVRNLIREGKTHQLDNVIRTSADIGMVSLEHSLVKLVREGLITIDRAQEYAVRPEEVVRLLKG